MPQVYLPRSTLDQFHQDALGQETDLNVEAVNHPIPPPPPPVPTPEQQAAIDQANNPPPPPPPPPMASVPVSSDSLTNPLGTGNALPAAAAAAPLQNPADPQALYQDLLQRSGIAEAPTAAAQAVGGAASALGTSAQDRLNQVQAAAGLAPTAVPQAPTPVVPTAPVPSDTLTQPIATAAKLGSGSQFGDPQLTAEEAYSACGPAAAVRFAQAYGRNPSLREATDMARQVGWTTAQGMAGLGSEKRLMDNMGVPTKLVNGADWGTFANEARTGNPIIISTANHYFTADNWNPQTNQFHVGQSGLDLKQGKEWMTPDEMTGLMGAVQGGLLADHPSAPGSTISGAPSASSSGIQSTAGLSGGGQLSGKIGKTGQDIMGQGAAAAGWLGDQGQKALQAVLMTEGGLAGARGDGGKSAGPLQFYEGGQLANFAKQAGLTLDGAKQWVEDNPVAAIKWAIGTAQNPGYLGKAIQDGISKGLSGADLATYAQRFGQVSVSPERAGSNFQNLFGGGGGLVAGSGQPDTGPTMPTADVAAPMTGPTRAAAATNAWTDPRTALEKEASGYQASREQKMASAAEASSLDANMAQDRNRQQLAQIQAEPAIAPANPIQQFAKQLGDGFAGLFSHLAGQATSPAYQSSGISAPAAPTPPSDSLTNPTLQPARDPNAPMPSAALVPQADSAREQVGHLGQQIDRFGEDVVRGAANWADVRPRNTEQEELLRGDRQANLGPIPIEPRVAGAKEIWADNPWGPGVWGARQGAGEEVLAQTNPEYAALKEEEQRLRDKLRGNLELLPEAEREYARADQVIAPEDVQRLQDLHRQMNEMTSGVNLQELAKQNPNLEAAEREAQGGQSALATALLPMGIGRGVANAGLAAASALADPAGAPFALLGGVEREAAPAVEDLFRWRNVAGRGAEEAEAAARAVARPAGPGHARGPSLDDVFSQPLSRTNERAAGVPGNGPPVPRDEGEGLGTRISDLLRNRQSGQVATGVEEAAAAPRPNTALGDFIRGAGRTRAGQDLRALRSGEVEAHAASAAARQAINDVAPERTFSQGATSLGTDTRPGLAGPGELTRIAPEDIPNKRIFEASGSTLGGDGGYTPPSIRDAAITEETAGLPWDQQVRKVIAALVPNLRIPRDLHDPRAEAFTNAIRGHGQAASDGRWSPEATTIGALVTKGSIGRGQSVFTRLFGEASGMAQRIFGERPTFQAQTGPAKAAARGLVIRPELIWAHAAGDTTDSTMMGFLTALSRKAADEGVPIAESSFATRAERDNAIAKGVEELYRRALVAGHGAVTDRELIKGTRISRKVLNEITGDKELREMMLGKRKAWADTVPELHGVVQDWAQQRGAFEGLTEAERRSALLTELDRVGHAGMRDDKIPFFANMSVSPEYGVLDLRMRRDVFGLDPKAKLTEAERTLLEGKLAEAFPTGNNSNYVSQWKPWEYLSDEKTDYSSLPGVYDRVNNIASRAAAQARTEGRPVGEVIQELAKAEHPALLSYPTDPHEVITRLGVSPQRLKEVAPGTEGDELKKIIPEMKKFAEQAGVTIEGKPRAAVGGWLDDATGKFWKEGALDHEVSGPMPNVRFYAASWLAGNPDELSVMLVHRGPSLDHPGSVAMLDLGRLSEKEAAALHGAITKSNPAGWTVKMARSRKTTLDGRADSHLIIAAPEQTAADFAVEVQRRMDVMHESGVPIREARIEPATVEFMDQDTAREVIYRGPRGAQTEAERAAESASLGRGEGAGAEAGAAADEGLDAAGVRGPPGAGRQPDEPIILRGPSAEPPAAARPPRRAATRQRGEVALGDEGGLPNLGLRATVPTDLAGAALGGYAADQTTPEGASLPERILRDVAGGAAGFTGAHVGMGAALRAAERGRGLAPKLTELARAGRQRGEVASGFEQTADDLRFAASKTDNGDMLDRGTAAEQAASDRYYHGTAGEFPRPDPGKFDANGLFGPGYYLTSDPRVAGGVVASGGEQVGPSWLVSGVKRSRGEVINPGYAQQRAPADTSAVRDAAAAHVANPSPETEAALQEALRNSLNPPAGPNVRPVDVPRDLNLLDVEAPADPQLIDRLTQDMTPQQVSEFDAMLHGYRTDDAGNTDNYGVYNALRSALAEDDSGMLKTGAEAAAEVNKRLSDAGYDGIRYAGGKRVPMQDAAGRDIEHTATVVFPGSLDKIRNALSGRQGGSAATELAANLGGAVAGGAAGWNAPENEDAPAWERPARAAAGALFGGTLPAHVLSSRPGEFGYGALQRSLRTARAGEIATARAARAAASPASRVDKAVALTTSNMLSGIGTAVQNTFGGVAQTLSRPGAALLGGRPSDAARDVVMMASSLGDAVRAYGEAARTGVGATNPHEAAKLPGGPVGAALTVPLRNLTATDEFFRVLNGAGGAAAAASKKLRDNPAMDMATMVATHGPELVDAGKKAGREAVYAEGGGAIGDIGSRLGAIRSDLLRSSNTGDRILGGLMQWVMPMTGVPSTILGMGARILPGVNEATGAVQIARGIAKRDPEAVYRATRKTAIASAVNMAILGEVLQGNITGDGPTNPQEKARLMEAVDDQGNAVWRPNSIRVGGRWFDYSGLGHVAIPMAMIANGVQETNEWSRKPADKRGGMPELAGDVGAATMRTISNAWYLRNLGDVLDASKTGNLKTVGKSILATGDRLVPLGGLVNEARKYTDPIARDPQSIAEHFENRIPGLSSRVPPRYTATTGKPMEQPQDPLSIAFRGTPPGMMSPNPLAQEVSRLNAAGETVSVPLQDDQYAGAQQSREQTTLLRQTMGQAANLYGLSILTDPKYANATDKQKADALNKAVSQSRDVADMHLGTGDVARDERHQALREWAQTPHFIGVKGTPEEIQQQNFVIAEAKAKFSAYKDTYGDTKARGRLKADDPEAYKLINKVSVNSTRLEKLKKQIDERFGGELLREGDKASAAGLVGVGQTVLP